MWCQFCHLDLNRLPSNLYKVGLIFRDNHNKGSQPYVLSKTAHFHQYINQFLMDCLQTFTKSGNFSRRSQQGVTTLCFKQNCTFLFKPIICISVNTEWIVFKPSQSRVNFLRRLQQGVTTLCFKQNCTFSSISQSILNGLPSNLHKVGLIFQDNGNKG